jgi:hypothetical protein
MLRLLLLLLVAAATRAVALSTGPSPPMRRRLTVKAQESDVSDVTTEAIADVTAEATEQEVIKRRSID